MNTRHRHLAPWCLGLLLACVTGTAIALSVVGCGGDPPPNGEDPVTADDFNLPPGPPIFQDVTKGTGVDWTYRNGEKKEHLAIIESLGGGVGLFDFDNDGLLDLFVVGGGDFEKTDEQLGRRPKNTKECEHLLRTTDRSCKIFGYPCKLYKNLGNWKFKDVTDQVLKLDGPWFYSHGCAVGDFDCDGWPDLLVTGWGRVALFHNEPNPKDPTKRILVDVTKKAGLTCNTWSSSAGFADLDGDGYPDLYICCYGDWSWKKHPVCSYDGSTPDVCPPKQFHGLKHKLFLNNKDGTFTDVSETVEVLVTPKDEKKDVEVMKGLRPGGEEASKGLGVLIADLNQDGKPDIYVANDTVNNFLYFNLSRPGRLKFAEKGFESGTAVDDRGGPNGSMGLDLADYDGCGLPSIFVTNYEGEKHALYHNDWKPGVTFDRHFFSYRSNPTRIAALGQTYVGWGTGFVDLEHRGWEDLVIVNGHAIHRPQGKGVTVAQRPVLLRNEGDGTFKDWSRSGGDYFFDNDKPKVYRSRGLALGDIDNDGKVDAVVTHINTPPVAILRNKAETGGNHWLGIELRGEKNRDVVGARMSLKVGERTQWRFTKGGGSYLSARDPRQVFGLGKADKVGTITVVWPNRKEQKWEGLAVDGYYRLTQGKKDAEPLYGAKK